jgi:hypothetical protein
MTLALIVFLIDQHGNHGNPGTLGTDVTIGSVAVLPCVPLTSVNSVVVQDPDILDQAAALAERACDYDPAVRADAFKEGGPFYRKHEAKLFRLGQNTKDERRFAGLILQALGGKLDAEKLLTADDPRAKQVACDLLPEKKELIPELLRLIKDPNLGLRLAAGRAIGRLKDQTLRSQCQTEFSKSWQDQKMDAADLMSYYIMAHWYPQGYASTLQSYMNQADLDTCETAIGALCNLPSFEVTSNFSSNAVSALRNEKINFRLRELLLKAVAREAFSEILPFLTIENKKLRALVVDLVDKGLTNPLMAKTLVDIAKTIEKQKLDDGKEPPQPLMSWIEKWLKRLTGEEGDLGKYEEWSKTKYRTVVDKITDEAIKKGVAHLQTIVKEDGTWTFNGSYPVGVTALVVYTMLKCDVSPDDKHVAKGLAFILSKDPEGTYSASLVAMALATAIDKVRAKKKTTDMLPKWQQKLQQIADILIASQKIGGGWHYDIKLKTGTGVQVPAQNQDNYDFSNTQFAVLGLRAAANVGSKVPRVTWEKAMALYEKHQSSKDKGWPYVGRDPNAKVQYEPSSSHAMTAAGAYGWMICKSSLEQKISPEELGQKDRVQNALEYLTKNWKVDAAGLGDPYYWLYSLERMCMAGKIDRVGEHDWYYEGAAWLLARQKTTGAWVGNHGETVDTCFALLFLKRAFIATPYIESGDARKKPAKEDKPNK